MGRESVALLDGRVRMSVPRIQGRIERDSHRANGWHEWLWVATAGGTLTIEASETMRVGDVTQLVREIAPVGTRIEGAGNELAVAFPMRVVAREQEVVLADAHVLGADGLAIRVRVVTDERTVSRGGCLSLARDIVSSIATSTQRLDRRSRDFAFAGLSMDVPFGISHRVEWGDCFDVLRLEDVNGGPDRGPWLGIYDGSYPHTRGGELAFTRGLLGKQVPFFDDFEDGIHFRWGLLFVEDGSVRHVFYGARTERDLERMEAIAMSLRAATH